MPRGYHGLDVSGYPRRGFQTPERDVDVRQVIIIGSGPAGYTAAIYAARANLKPLLIASSVEAGGELMNTTEVENFPGFPEGIMGPDLMTKMQEQAEKFGTEVLYDDVVELDIDGPVKKVTLGSGATHEADSLVFATGSAPRKIGIEGESRLSGRGVSYCATCDGFFFRERTIAVVGGGDSAMEEATFLTKFASKVYVIHRRDELRASKIMQNRAMNNDKIEFIWNSEVADILGEDAVTGVVLRDTVDGSTRELALDGIFVAIGYDPRTHLVHGSLDLTEHGTVWVDGRSSRTSVPGVFAAGDVIDPTYRQAVTAAGSGTVAALDVEHYLAALGEASEPAADSSPLRGRPDEGLESLVAETETA
ncbi:thioredoxin-disulfide reductase [Microbacterium sp. AISO3]|jgi:thioredoxin reductase (NADPH)|nr:thioredoxin-disulfide reductase [Microbacterium sp. AISO3]OWP23482.1 thioredoxin-disulfide reductase [Microbacterium sp. AISO3]POX68359.1 thioredoxin-disulfide reductase [Microbacterium sp. Ru50]